ncbi:sugar phosphate isomerase/epimerase [Halopolyspora algeriensis]|uniref:Sugar phosphate isomerase/epimerase n=1 Tax=Halopolyspora algeriensis TaxID=1500506 RepID=A0A368VUJ1_9ACTN|nr:sugar phosphate isomerase/epimerase family protein [Halopolyspora algeriensis]RCW45776.1 sugar phosphate isomerase/epimerase [Halopolyspora algeriensis]TQM54160.1 sugar phosphate isomerase/epimerase [Halopolyspora algeriensis]
MSGPTFSRPAAPPAGTSSGQALRFGYGTNGFANHRLDDALDVLAEQGYSGVALTLDHAHLDPFAPEASAHAARLRRRLERLGLSVVIETGARYLLDPRHKHHPTLLSDPGQQRRIDFLRRAVHLATELGAEAVSFWSGTRPPDLGDDEAWQRLTDGCSAVLDTAAEHGVTLGFEPEPGMFVETLDGFEELAHRLGHPRSLGMTLDIGHCRCLEPTSVPDCVRRAGTRLVNVQIDDMRRGVHEHLEFGEGEIDFPPVLAALTEVGYSGLVSVELPRHSHAAPAVSQRSIHFLEHASRKVPA